MRKCIQVIGVVLSVSIIGALLIGAAKATYQASQRSRNTLRERAEQSGGKLMVMDTSYHTLRYNNIKDLVNDSPTIVVGTTLRNECRLTKNGSDINTLYQVRIEEVLKGTVNVGDSITVNTPGGIQVFNNSVWAAVQVPDFRPPRNSKRYALFLRPSPDNQVFTMTGGFQGAFELPGDGSKVRASDRRAKTLSRNSRDNDEASFLKGIRLSLKN